MISIVIPARNEHPQATFTLQVIWDQLEHSGLEWETILVDNLSTDATSEFAEKRRWWKEGRHHTIHYDEKGSCWCARREGVKAAKGDIIFLFDAHVVIGPDLFRKQVEFFETHPEAWICFTPVIWMGESKQKGIRYGYSLGQDNGHMKSKFWGSWTSQKPSDDPFMIPMSGTAGIAIRKERMEELMWPEALSVYGGGEQWVSLLAWMKGGNCWIHPDTWLYHYAYARKYAGSQDENGFSTNDAHMFNRCLVAYALGGEEWWEVALNKALGDSTPHYYSPIEALAEKAKAQAEPYRKWVQENTILTLDEVLSAKPWEMVMEPS